MKVSHVGKKLHEACGEADVLVGEWAGKRSRRAALRISGEGCICEYAYSGQWEGKMYSNNVSRYLGDTKGRRWLHS